MKECLSASSWANKPLMAFIGKDSWEVHTRIGGQNWRRSKDRLELLWSPSSEWSFPGLWYANELDIFEERLWDCVGKWNKYWEGKQKLRSSPMILKEQMVRLVWSPGEVVGHPNRWSLLLIFGFLCWSSQTTEKCSIVMCYSGEVPGWMNIEALGSKLGIN